MQYVIGQKVLFLREPGGGTIVQIPDRYHLMIESEDGFTRKYKVSEVTHVRGQLIIDEEALTVKDIGSQNSGSKVVNRGGLPLIDLHIHELTEEGFDESNGHALERQMRELKKFVEYSRGKKVRDLIIIHGVGSGILRSEVRDYLKGIPGAEFFDADYSEFGEGATRVIFRYSY